MNNASTLIQKTHDLPHVDKLLNDSKHYFNRGHDRSDTKQPVPRGEESSSAPMNSEYAEGNLERTLNEINLSRERYQRMALWLSGDLPKSAKSLVLCAMGVPVEIQDPFSIEELAVCVRILKSEPWMKTEPDVVGRLMAMSGKWRRIIESHAFIIIVLEEYEDNAVGAVRRNLAKHCLMQHTSQFTESYTERFNRYKTKITNTVWNHVVGLMD